jgi:hypothetical protein
MHNLYDGRVGLTIFLFSCQPDSKRLTRLLSEDNHIVVVVFDITIGREHQRHLTVLRFDALCLRSSRCLCPSAMIKVPTFAVIEQDL